MPFDTDNIAFAIPAFEMDKIIYSKTFSTTVDDNTLSGDTYVLEDTNFTESSPVLGIYSVDAGTTWTDFSQYPSGTVQLRPTVRCTVTLRSNSNLEISKGQSSLINGGSPYTLLSRVIILAKEEEPSLDPANVSIEGNILYSSKYNYLKVHDQGSYHVASSDTTVIPHNLGYEPFVLVSYKDDVLNQIDELFPVLGEGAGSQTGVVPDSTNLTIYTASGDRTIYYRIYKDR